jgi:CheY-like chemotaxis protein
VSDDPARHLRHEVRTSIAQISGYCELLLEEVADQGWDELTPDLLAIQSRSKEALAQAADLGAVAAATVPLLAHTERAQARLVDLGDQACITDIAAIERAARHLLDLVKGAETSAGPRAVAPAEAPSVPEARALPSGRVLVVDDDPGNRDLLQRRLQRLGCDVAAAEHGRQALEMLADSPFDLVLLDVMMPEMDGYATLGRLKADPSLQHVPVIVLSAIDDLESAVRCIELGAEDYLSKPINPALLRARVETCLEKKRLRDQEAAYLRDVGRVTAAAGAIEAAVFEPASLADLAARGDALAGLVRVLQDVAAAYAHQALLAAENARLNGILREQVDELERSRRLIASAEERLRQQIAELLHSRVQNRLLLAWHRLQDACDRLADDPARARALLAEVAQQVDEVREHDVRQVSHLLHPSIIQVGLVPALERLAEDFLPQFRIDLQVDDPVADLDDPEHNHLPEPVRLAAYRVVEEAFGNAARHARARQVDVALSLRTQQLAIRVRDDGQGFDPAAVRAGLGLSSIAARVGAVGGTWAVTSAPGQGAALEALLPLTVADDAPLAMAAPLETKRLA